MVSKRLYLIPEIVLEPTPPFPLAAQFRTGDMGEYL